MLALVVVVEAADAELVADALWSLGVVAIEERGGGRPGTIELWTSLGDDEQQITEALGAVDHVVAWWFEHVDDAIAETWREHATPTWVADDFVVHPAWIEPPAVDGITIAIEPGSTFGLGDHPTTVLCLRALRAVIEPGAFVLDVGCGSGVLAIAACRLGAATADAVDIAPAAVAVTRANADRNGVGDQVSVSNAAVTDLAGEYDVVVANILAPTLIEIADDLVRLVGSAGRLIISGILTAKHEHVLAALQPLRPIASADLDGWSAVTLTR